MEKKKLTNEELEYCIKEFSDGAAYFFKDGITVSLKDLCEEIIELRRENLLLGGKARYFEGITKKLINDEELTTGEMNTCCWLYEDKEISWGEK